MSKKNQGAAILIETIHQDLLDVKTYIFKPCGFKCSPPVLEKESAEYGAYAFKLNDFLVRFRVAKTTPTKIGQFVTLWKRIGNGPIQPYDAADSVDFFIISTRKDNHFGQFIFPKNVLCEQAILTTKEHDGKRGIRVYPPWDKTLNRQAQKTQKWQLEYFLEIPQSKEVDRERVQLLYSQRI